MLLGASNLVRGFHVVLRAAREAWGDPLEVMAASGLGRSYGLRSAVLGRVLPGIVECGLWRELERRPALATRAVVTDVGNDVLYNAAVPDILGWVETCVRRLREIDAAVVVTGLPLERLVRFSRAGYVLLRLALFPFHRWLSFDEALARAHALAEGVERLAERHGAAFVPARGEWYGLDPVHMRLGAWGQAWRSIVTAGAGGEATTTRPLQVASPSAVRLYLARPERRWLFGIEQRRDQPALPLPAGGSVSFY